MGLSASQGRLLLLTARQTDLELQAQMISQKRLDLSQKLTEISSTYSDAVANRQMKITMSSTDGTGDKATTNLTYAKLISGCSSMDSSASGLNIVDGINTVDGYASSACFRLVNSDGAIVVSDVSEIPGAITTTTSASSKGSAISNLPIYDQKATVIDNVKSSTTTATTKYCPVSTIENFSSSDLGKIGLNETTAKSCTFVTDGTNYYIKYGDNYYNTKGEKQTLDDDTTSSLKEYTYDKGDGSTGTVKFVYGTDNVPKSTSTTKEALDPTTVKNNKVTVNGQVYVIDSALKGNDSDPNYLQDCLRNGKYFIQKYVSNTTSATEAWTDIAWDSASYISDYYYEDDDAAAQAEYDRESEQVEAQDKKLQLELDKVETQHDAVKTEKESVRKVIDDNVEKTFNTFA